MAFEKEGLGDKVEKAIKKVGGHKVAKQVERITKRPCGCQKRKDWLNQFGRRFNKKP